MPLEIGALWQLFKYIQLPWSQSYDDRARSGFSFAMQSLLERIKLNRHHKIDPFQLWSHHLDHLRVFTCVSIFTLMGAISIASILESRLLKPSTICSLERILRQWVWRKPAEARQRPGHRLLAYRHSEFPRTRQFCIYLES